MPLDDPYSSRTGEPWSFAPRLDPVLWSERPTVLDDAERAFFAERGYLVKPQLFTHREVASLMAEARRLADAADPSADSVITEPGGSAIRSLFRVHVESAMMSRLARDPRLVGVAQEVLGSEVYVHQSRINFKPAFEGHPFQWHSDFETWHVEDGMPRMRALSASLLLTLNTPHNGPLLVIPGSHRRYVRCQGETPLEHFRSSLRVQELGSPDREALATLFDEGGIEAITGPAGTVVFFDCNLQHGSGGNITPLPRHNVFFVFNSVNNRLVEPFGGLPPRPTFLGER